MGRKRNPERDRSLQRYIDSGGTMTLDELAMAAGVPKARISKWKSEDEWKNKLKEVPKKRGGQRGNKNAKGRTPAKDGNKNAVTHGAYAKVDIEDITSEEAGKIEQTLQEDNIQRMREELQSLLVRRVYLERLLKKYTDPDADGKYYVDKIVHMVVPKGIEEQQQKNETRIKIGQVQDPEAVNGSSEKLKTAMKSIIKASAFDRAMKVESELNRLNGRIIKQLDSMKSYDIEMQRLQLEKCKYDLAKQKLIGEIDIDDEEEEIIDEPTVKDESE